MKDHGLEVYKRDGMIARLTHGKDKVKLKKVDAE